MAIPSPYYAGNPHNLMEAFYGAEFQGYRQDFRGRHNSQTIKVKELIDSGIIGKLNLIRGSFSYKLQTLEGNIRLDPALGGGCLWDLGCYPISFARYIIGCNPIEVSGWRKVDKNGVDLSFVGEIRFPQDIFVQFDCAFELPLRDSMEFVGSEGTISIASAFMRSSSKRIVMCKDGNIQEIPIDVSEHRYFGEIKDINDAILFNKPPRVSLEESRSNVATINALISSARDNKIVSVCC